ncbi:MAG: metallophosphoesterase family protein [candidate division KSB1 bacterium]|nr:metallophosphoesterase family protein [candidate division KSB1 bacterium]
MRYGLISDIHGNLEALTVVIKELEKRNVDEVLCLGDIIGYGPDPEECVDLVKRYANVILAGNHDYAAMGILDISYFNPHARRAIEWTAGQISDETRKFLKERPLMMVYDDFTIVHATPAEPEKWNYILSLEDAADNFAHFHNQVCFIGHSHVPVIIAKDKRGKISVRKGQEIQLQDSEKYIINIGSVGQPRDLDPRAAFAIFDTETKHYELLRAAYDIQTTQQKILKKGLPYFLAERLAKGQ